MNMNEMQSAWNSPRNNLPTEEQQRLAHQLTRQMIRRRRFQAIWLINTFVFLTVTTAMECRFEPDLPPIFGRFCDLVRFVPANGKEE